MIIITGHEGFIGKKFLEKLEGKEIIKVEKNNSWHFRTFNEWQKVELIIHLRYYMYQPTSIPPL